MITCVRYEGGCLGRNKGCENSYLKIAEHFKIKLPLIDKENSEEALKSIEKLKGKRFVGGDHSITFSLVKGFSFKFKKFGLIVLDAHADCCKSFKIVTHEDWLRSLIEEKIIKKENVLLVGVREIDKTEQAFLKNLRVVNWKNLDEIKSFLLKFKNVYLSIDVDVIDPEDAPGTGCKVKKGLRKKEFLKLIRFFKEFKNVKRIDVVEFNHLLDRGNKTANLVIKTLEILK